MKNGASMWIGAVVLGLGLAVVGPKPAFAVEEFEVRTLTQPEARRAYMESVQKNPDPAMDSLRAFLVLKGANAQALDADKLMAEYRKLKKAPLTEKEKAVFAELKSELRKEAAANAGRAREIPTASRDRLVAGERVGIYSRLEKRLAGFPKLAESVFIWSCPNPPTHESSECFARGKKRLESMDCLLDAQSKSKEECELSGAFWTCLGVSSNCRSLRNGQFVPGCAEFSAEDRKLFTGAEGICKRAESRREGVQDLSNGKSSSSQAK